MIAKLGGRKFVVIMFALMAGTAIAFTCKADVVTAFAGLASICVTAYMGAHAIADSKWGNGKTDAAA